MAVPPRRLGFPRRLLAGALALLAALILPTGCGQATPPPPPDRAADPTLAREWLAAVATGKEEKALALATRLLGGQLPAAPPSRLAERLCRDAGVEPAFLTDGFSPWDFQRWRQAWFFHRLAAEILAGTADEPHATLATLAAAVHGRLAAAEPPRPHLPWPMAVWETGRGLCDRQAWVLCELAYQRGFDTQIIYLRNPATGASPHAICELRKAGRSWIADPFQGKLLPGTSLGQLAASPKLRAALWPERPDWQAALARAECWLPAFPHDYCPRNQWLAAAVGKALGAAAPRFGEPPAGRQRRWRSGLSAPDRAFRAGYWPVPFRLLAADQARQRAALARRNGGHNPSF